MTAPVARPERDAGAIFVYGRERTPALIVEFSIQPMQRASVEADVGGGIDIVERDHVTRIYDFS